MLKRGVKLPLLVAAALVAALTIGLIGVSHAAATTVTLELKDVDVTTAIESLFKGSGKNYIIEPGVYGRIPTLSIKDVEFDQALRLITRTTGLTYRIDQDTYMITTKPATTGTMGPGGMTPGPGGMMPGPGGMMPGPGGMMPGPGGMNVQVPTATTTKPAVLEKFQLMYSSAFEIEDLIYGGGGTRGYGSDSYSGDYYGDSRGRGRSSSSRYDDGYSSGSSRSSRSSSSRSTSSRSSSRDRNW